MDTQNPAPAAAPPAPTPARLAMPGRAWLRAGRLVMALLGLAFGWATAADRIDLAPRVAYLKDPQHGLPWEQVAQLPPEHWRPWQGPGDFNIGYSADTVWLRITLPPAGAESRRLLEIPYPTLGQLTLYAPGKAPVSTGEGVPAAQRPWPHRHFVFVLALAPEPSQIYLRVRSSGPITVPLVLWRSAALASETQSTYMALSLYYGALLALVAYNLLIFLSLREQAFLRYALFAGSMGLAMVFGNGIGQQFLWPDDWSWHPQLMPALYSVTAALGLAFSRSFLHTATRQPKTDRWLLGLSLGGGLLALALAARLPIPGAWQWLGLLSMASGALIVFAVLRAITQGDRSARYFLLAWGLLWVGVFVATLRNFGWIPTNNLTAYAVQISSAAEMLLLSFALADRIRLERQAREAAQAETLALRQSLVESLQRSESVLERAIAERTAELTRSLQNERSLLERFVRFGSFISHEFRNPLAIIQAQVNMVALERERGIDKLGQRLPAIRNAVQRLVGLFDDWLSSGRLHQTTEALSLSPIALGPWLEQRLHDARQRHRDHVLGLQMDQPPTIVGDEAMLRIALGNLISNAAKYAPTHTEIGIGAARHGNEVVISVTDQGPGIPSEHQARVFDDYFRADPTGPVEGLGLGLALVRRVAQLHGGRVALHSQAGQGCRFELWLPVSPPSGEPAHVPH